MTENALPHVGAGDPAATPGEADVAIPSPPKRSPVSSGREGECDRRGVAISAVSSSASRGAAVEDHRQHMPTWTGHLLCRSRTHLNGGRKDSINSGSQEPRAPVHPHI